MQLRQPTEKPPRPRIKVCHSVVFKCSLPCDKPPSPSLQTLEPVQTGRGGRMRITGARRTGLGPEYVAYVFVFLGSIMVCSTVDILSHQGQVAVQLADFWYSVSFF